MSQENEEISRMQSRLASLAKEHDTTKQILIGTKRKIIIRTLKQKLDESKKTNKQLRSSNLTLMTSNISLRKQVTSLKRKYDDLRELTATSLINNFDLQDDDFCVICEEPKSPQSTTSQATSTDDTPKRTPQNATKITQKGNPVVQILEFNDDDQLSPTRSPSFDQTDGTKKRTRKSKRISSQRND